MQLSNLLYFVAHQVKIAHYRGGARSLASKLRHFERAAA
jgi:hypothetical protein